MVSMTTAQSASKEAAPDLATAKSEFAVDEARRAEVRRKVRTGALVSSLVFLLAAAMVAVGMIYLRGTYLGFGLAFAGAIISCECFYVYLVAARVRRAQEFA